MILFWITRVTFSKLLLQMTKVLQNQECDEHERLIPSSSKEEEEEEEEEEEDNDEKENLILKSKVEELESSQSDIPIDSSPLLCDRRRPSRWPSENDDDDEDDKVSFQTGDGETVMHVEYVKH